MEYVGKNKSEGLRTEDVSRIAFQLLSAVDHCERHNILHRDIKPGKFSAELLFGMHQTLFHANFIYVLPIENVMFKANTPTAELRLIDFGCSTMDEEKDQEHTTFAGTPFYISPEMFQKKYTVKTDVFSVGVVMYVLVAGYPAEQLQAAFNILQKSKRDLKSLPGMPDSMPETYYEMLDKMLAYRYKARKSAAEVLEDEFVLFHKHLETPEKEPSRRSLARTKSIVLSGTGEAAVLTFGFTKFQRSGESVINYR